MNLRIGVYGTEFISQGNELLKRLFSRQTFVEMKRMTTSSSSQKHSVKTQQRKNENMKFLAGSKIWRENFKNIFLPKKKKIFEMKYFPEIFFSNFGTKQKLHLFVFFLLGIERKSFPEEKIFLPGERFLRVKSRSRKIQK